LRLPANAYSINRLVASWEKKIEKEVDPGHEQDDYAEVDEAELLTGDGQFACRRIFVGV